MPLGAAAAATAVLWVLSPALGDLQAAIAREEAARSGVGVEYWFGWYGGVSPGSYSLIVPALSSLIGSLPLLCVATMCIAALAYLLSRGAAHPTALSWAIALAAVLNMMSGRVTFAVGAAFAVAAVLALRRRMFVAGAVGLLISGLASPLAPAFAGIIVVPFLLINRTRTPLAWAALIGSAAGVAVPFILFGAPGSQGFPWTTLFWVVLIGVGAATALTVPPASWIAPLATASALVLFVVPTGVGSNISRFFCLVLPCAVLFFSRRSLKFLAIALVPAVAYASFVAIADQVAVADAQKPEQVYAPLRTQLLGVSGLDNHRVELVDAGTHAGSHMLGKDVKLARGWENQSDSRYNPIFYQPGALNSTSYRHWLAENAVSYVAVATKPLRQVKEEAALINTGLPYLARVWRNPDWALYRVASPTPIVPPPLRLIVDSPSRLVIDVPRASTYVVRVRPNRYLVAREEADPAMTACIAETSDGWITMRTFAPGRYELQGSFTVRGVLAEQSPQCG